jgi:Tfp pilus assembly protein PilX
MIRPKKQDGFMLIIVMTLAAIMLVFSTALLGYTGLHVRQARQSAGLSQALALAEAGIDKSITELNNNSGYAGENSTAFGNGEFTTSVSTIDNSTKRITSTGYFPNSSEPIATRTVKILVRIDATDVAFNYGVQVGEAGLVMSNNSEVIGNVFSNGNISGSGRITGDAAVAAGSSSIPDQECTSTDQDFVFANNDINKREVAQKFTPTQSGSLSKIKIYLKKSGTPANLTIRIMPHNSATNEAQRSGQIGGNGTFANIGTNYGWIEGTFATAPVLTAGTSYWIVLDGTNNSATSYYTVAIDGTNACPGDGKYTNNYTNNPPSWQPIAANPGADLNFQTFFGGAITTLTGVTVDGDAYAQHMESCTIGNDAFIEDGSTDCSVSGTTTTGVAAPSPQALPVSDAQIADWRVDAAAGGVINGPYTVTGTESLGPIEINGDFRVNIGATLNMTGVIWVKGNVIIDNDSTVRLDAAYGSNSGVILGDDQSSPATKGIITVSNNVNVLGSGAVDSYVMFLTTNTSANAMYVSNNANGAIFYANAGTIVVNNNAGARELTGYGISMANNTTITYSSGLQNATFTSGPGASWIFEPGSYVIVK